MKAAMIQGKGEVGKRGRETLMKKEEGEELYRTGRGRSVLLKEEEEETLLERNVLC